MCGLKQVGPAVGINGADDLVMSRFLLQRVAEDLQVVVSLDPKVKGTGEKLRIENCSAFSQSMTRPVGTSLFESGRVRRCSKSQELGWVESDRVRKLSNITDRVRLVRVGPA